MPTKTEPDVMEKQEVNTQAGHALCDTCYPFDKTPFLPENVLTLCGLVIPTSAIPFAEPGEDPFAIPPDACALCMAVARCPTCGTKVE
jgi:hypothetical protein